MKENKLAQEVYHQLYDDIDEFKNENFVHLQAIREIDTSMNFNKLKEECKKLNMNVKLAKEDKYFNKLLKENKIKNSWLFETIS